MRRLIIILLVVNAIVITGRLVQEWRPEANAGAGAVPSGNGDVNGDGDRDVSDAIYLLLWLFRNGPEPVALAGSPDLDMRVEALETAVADLARRIPSAESVAREIADNHAGILVEARDVFQQSMENLARLTDQPELAERFPTTALRLLPEVEGGARSFALTVDGASPGQVIAFSGSEVMSELYRFQVAFTRADPALKTAALVGTPAALSMTGASGETVYGGVVDAIGLRAFDGRTATYVVEIVPPLAKLALTRDSRVFQNLPLADIIDQILTEAGLMATFVFDGTSEVHQLAIQYNESDLDFIRRRAERQGVFHYFGVNDRGLVIGDSAAAYGAVPGGRFAFHGNRADPASPFEEFVSTLAASERLASGKYVARDYNFEMPEKTLEVSASVAMGDPTANLEVYDYPGLYANVGDGEDSARINLERLQRDRSSLAGTGNVPGFSPGHKFTLVDRVEADLDGEYALTAVTHVGLVISKGAEARSYYGNSFECVPAAVPYRPLRVTPDARMPGVQTAVVVGPVGEEIHTDKFGRVKVQFHWDREGQPDESSSAWIRVAQMWSGAGWGSVIIPRIGQEVIVDFEEGNPDRPLITGTVYNAANMPPYQLPANKTVAGVKSNSTVGGGGFNELTFDDTKDNELVSIRAQYDMQLTNENDMVIDSGQNATLATANDMTITAGNAAALTVGTDLTVRGNGNLDISGGGALSLGGAASTEIESADVAIRSLGPLSVGAINTEIVSNGSLAMTALQTELTAEDLRLTARKLTLLTEDTAVTGKLVSSTAAGPGTRVSVGERTRDNAIVAWALVAADGSTGTDEYGVLRVTHTGTGTYTIAIDAVTKVLVPVAAPRTDARGLGAHVASVAQTGPSEVTVFIRGLDGRLVDGAFAFMATAR